MKTKKELLKTALAMDTAPDYCQLYEYASKYLNSIKYNGTAADFYALVKTLYSNPTIKQNAAVIGFSGNNYPPTVTKWCKYILSNKALASLELSELHYVMGYCARLSKIHK